MSANTISREIRTQVSSDKIIYYNCSTSQFNKDTNSEGLLLNIDGVELRGFLEIRKKTSLEEIQDYSDNLPLLHARKACSILKIWISLLCLEIVKSTVFEVLVLIVILMNTLTLALEGTYNPPQHLERVYLYIYSVECLLKILAYGFLFCRGAYLRDNWNILDFVIVIAGWVENLVSEGVNLSALRVLRILRPLRSISSIQGIKIIFKVLLSSIKPLSSTITILLFFCFVFATIGLQLWIGILKYRCININSGYIGDDEKLCGERDCGALAECGKTLSNPDLGATNFDNILYSMLTVFQLLTLEGWSSTMVYLQQAFSAWVVIYFIPLVLLGSFLLMNLTLAFIKMKFTDTIKSKSNMRIKHTRRSVRVVKKSTVSSKNSLVKIEYDVESIDDPSSEIRSDNSFLSFSSECPPGEKPSFEFEGEIGNDQKRLLMLKIAPICKAPLSANNNGDYNHDELFIEEEQHYPCPPINRNSSNYYILGINFLTALCESKEKLKDFLLRSSSFVIRLNEHHVVVPASAEDILQSSVISQEYISPVYAFEYVESPYEEKKTNNFKELRKRLSCPEAYVESIHLAKEIVRRVKSDDKRTKFVQGVWSGTDVKDRAVAPYKLNELQLWSYGVKGQLQKVSGIVNQLVSSKWFTHFITLSVVLNTLVLAMDHHGIPSEMSNVLFYLNLAFTIEFTCEMGLKIIALGLKQYFQDSMNYLDVTVVVFSLLELAIFSESSSSFSAFRTLRIFRTFRILRVARLFRYLEYMTKLLRVIGVSISISFYLALLLLIFTMIFALLGMQLFGGNFNFEEGTPRANFDTFHNAFVTMFQVLSLEDWNSVLYNAMRSSVGPVSALFFVLWIFVGNFILLNLFLAILLDSFSNASSETVENNEMEYTGMNSLIQRAHNTTAYKTSSKNRRRLMSLCEKLNAHVSMNSAGDSFKSERNTEFEIMENIACKMSFWIFSKTNPVRQFCYKLSTSSNFEHVIISCIILTSFKLVLDTYWIDYDDDAIEVQISSIGDIIFNGIFTIEVLIKSITLGFLFDRRTYLKEFWNQLDFFIVTISWMDLLFMSDSLQSIKILRLLRTLRPLRFISHNKSMKVVVNALLNSFVAIINVGIVVLIVWLIFAILGVSFFSGKLYKCENPLLKSQSECESYGYNWEQDDTNFDNVIEAMMTLFIISSLEGWPQIMYNVVDATEPGHAPSKNAQPEAAYFFIVFIIVGSFFFLNLFIGVVFEKFQEERDNDSSMFSYFLSHNQQKWVELQRIIPRSQPEADIFKAPESKLRRCFFKIGTSTAFELTIFGLIIANMFQMALSYDGASEEYLLSLEYLNLGLTGCFVAETMVKMVGFGLVNYFYDNWNKFDFFVVTASLVEVVFYFSGEEGLKMLRLGPQLARVFKLARVIKLFRLIKSLKDIQSILETIKYSIPSMLNVLSLVTLFFFIYAILGILLFRDVEEGEIINEYLNFKNFHSAMTTLFTISTGENWFLFMYDCKKASTVSAYLYFSSFNVITTFIMINLFVMIILQSLDEHYDNPESPIDTFNRTIKRFKEIWRNYSHANKGLRMSSKQLSDFLVELGPPLGAERGIDKVQLARLIASLNVPIDESGQIYYHDLVFSVYKNKFGRFRFKNDHDKVQAKIIVEEENKTMVKLRKLRKKEKRTLLNESIINSWHSSLFIFHQIKTLKAIFCEWKLWTQRKRAKRSAF